jgi:hypothetical protein
MPDGPETRLRRHCGLIAPGVSKNFPLLFPEARGPIRRLRSELWAVAYSVREGNGRTVVLTSKEEPGPP